MRRFRWAVLLGLLVLTFLWVGSMHGAYSLTALGMVVGVTAAVLARMVITRGRVRVRDAAWEGLPGAAVGAVVGVGGGRWLPGLMLAAAFAALAAWLTAWLTEERPGQDAE